MAPFVAVLALEFLPFAVGMTEFHDDGYSRARHFRSGPVAQRRSFTSVALIPLDQSGSASIARMVANVIISVIGCNGDSTNPRDR